MMRKLFVALLVGAVAVGMAAPAFAADLKFTGHYRIRTQFDENFPCATEEIDCSGNFFQTRFRPRFDVETEGGVRGVLRLEIGDVRFGAANGGQIGADGVNVETKWAYVDFPLPATPLRLRAGIQPYFLAKALFLDDDGSGLSIYGKLGEINANAWWMRASENTPTGTDPQGNDAVDIYGIDLSFSPTRDLTVNGYGVYAHDSSEDPGATLDAWWLGVGAAGKVQNIRWDVDFVYGLAEIDTTSEAKGWVVDAGVGMALPGTPLDLELRGWYATGDDGSGGDSDAFPVISAGWNSSGAQIWCGGCVVDADDMADTPENSWGVGVLARWTASPQLRLTGNVHYIGTVEDGVVGGQSPVGNGDIGNIDSVGTEVGIRADYTLYRGLTLTATVSHLFMGDDQPHTPFVGNFGTVTEYDDITKIGISLDYSF